jgi:asparagine synthase (glutamine-hydrolysing)
LTDYASRQDEGIMCGIAGYFQPKQAAAGPEQARAAVTAMIHAMAHRGPDGSGVENAADSPCVVLGHRRLAIVDPSDTASQPMRDPHSGNCLVCDGELYNFHELRQQLRGLQEFRGQSDAELILKAYAQWGAEAIPRLRGMFAFALWDAQRRELIIARDPLGIKPLYYAWRHGALLFASEVRALLAGGIPGTLSPEGLQSFLAYGAVQEPYSLVHGVQSLPPGHMLRCQGDSHDLRPFWLPPPTDAAPPAPTLPALQEKVHAALQHAVASQRVADVKLGTFLSGGIDSAAIVALLRQTTSDDLYSFTLAFADKRYDERQFAALSAKANAFVHSEFELDDEELKNNLPTAITAFDQPSIDGLNTWFAAKAARSAGLNVVLSGVGGDELFVGYQAFRNPRRLHRLQKLLRAMPLRLAVNALSARSDSEKLRKLARLADYPYPATFLNRQILSPELRQSLLCPDVLATTGVGDWEQHCFAHLASHKGHDLINDISFWEMRSYMLSTLLRDSDQMSMAHGLEIRVPLIDQDLVELMLTIPGRAKLGPIPKPLLVHAAGAGLPDACVKRPKQGFVLPFDHYFQDVLRSELLEAFHPAQDGLFRRQALAKLWQGYERKQVPWGRIWMIFVLRHWLRQQLAIS